MLWVNTSLTATSCNLLRVRWWTVVLCQRNRVQNWHNILLLVAKYLFKKPRLQQIPYPRPYEKVRRQKDRKRNGECSKNNLVLGVVDERGNVFHQLVVRFVVVGNPVLERVVVDGRHVPRERTQHLGRPRWRRGLLL